MTPTEKKFRASLAERAVRTPEFFRAENWTTPPQWTPHPELTRISDAIRAGGSLKEIAIRAWTFQDTHGDLRVIDAARFRTIYRRIMRHLNTQVAA